MFLVILTLTTPPEEVLILHYSNVLFDSNKHRTYNQFNAGESQATKKNLFYDQLLL